MILIEYIGRDMKKIILILLILLTSVNFSAELDKYGNPLHPAFLQCRADEDFQHIMLNIVEAVGRVAYAADCKSV